MAAAVKHMWAPGNATPGCIVHAFAAVQPSHGRYMHAYHGAHAAHEGIADLSLCACEVCQHTACGLR